MKKSAIVLSFLVIALSLLLSCSKEGPKYKDGEYTAEEKGFEDNGWKNMVSVTVEKGRIAAADWNAISQDGGESKKTRSVQGEYDMASEGLPWHVQAEKAADYLIKIQDPLEMKYKDNSGLTDSISGVSISVLSFFKLAEKALEKAK